MADDIRFPPRSRLTAPGGFAGDAEFDRVFHGSD
jgi:hypothetical protein